jgi:hypothetical protein
MTVTVYRSTDASAPSMTGQVGALISVLDACLVNGYGAKAAAGWGKAFTGTNIASYRAAAGNRYYLGVDDTNAQNARVRGFETMSAAGDAVASGTGPTPTDVQVSGGNYYYKSSAASSQVRPWMLLANDRFFMLFTNVSTASATPASTGFNSSMIWGDFWSFVSGDTYNTLISSPATASSSDPRWLVSTVANSSLTDSFMPYVIRPYNNTGTSIQVPKMSLGQMLHAASSGSAGQIVYPALGVGGLLLPYWMLVDQSGASKVIRGAIPGLWFMCGPAASFTHGDTFSGSGALAGKTFEIVKEDFNNTCWAVETSNWTAPVF